jgi:HNH endonuclease
VPLSTVIDRLSTKIIVADDGCLEWSGSLRTGYGKFRGKDGGTTSAHRVVWETFVGPIPEGMDLDHLCRNRKCVNPDHLEPVTRRENLRRGSNGVLKTHCKNGHEYTEENTIWRKADPGNRHRPNGSRGCRTCINIGHKVYRDRKRSEGG